MYKQGVILELREKEAVVFNEAAGYEKIERIEGMFVGQIVEYKKTKNKDMNRFIWAISTAAVLIAIFFSYGLYQNSREQVFAYVTLDINPSMEFSINNKNCVIRLKPLNHEAEEITRSLEVKGKNIYTAVEDVIAELKRQGYISYKNENIIVLSTSASDLWDKEDERNTKINETTSFVEETVKNCTKSYALVQIVSATPEMRKLSIKADMSLGRYALYAKALEEGKSMPLEYAKTAPLSQLIGYGESEEVNADKVDSEENTHNSPGTSTPAVDKIVDKGIDDINDSDKTVTDSSKPKVEIVKNEPLTKNDESEKVTLPNSTIPVLGKDVVPESSPTIPYNDEKPTRTAGVIIPTYTDELPKPTPRATIQEYIDENPRTTGAIIPKYTGEISRPTPGITLPEHSGENGTIFPDHRLPDREKISPKPLPSRPTPDDIEVDQKPAPDDIGPIGKDEEHGPFHDKDPFRKRLGNPWDSIEDGENKAGKQ